MKDLCIIQENNPTLLIQVGESLGKAGINIEGLSLSSLNKLSVVHFLVEDEKASVNTLKSIGIEVSAISEVFVFHKDKKQVTGKPGSFGGICRTLNENGLKIIFGYPAENNRFVFGVDNIEKAKQLLS